MDKIERKLIKQALQLDEASNADGLYARLSKRIVEEQTNEPTIVLLYKINQMTESDATPIEIKRLAFELKESLVIYHGTKTISDLCSKKDTKNEQKTLAQLLHELDNLVGLDTVKLKVKNLIDYQKVQKMRRNYNLQTSKNTLHLAFVGNPGTGKTTVARIIGQVYKHIGLLSKGHFVEVSRTDLIAGYQGQTALKVKKVIDNSKGGVLFIDEAYSITENDHSDSYGRECLTELTKALEDYRDDLVVIVAGYSEPMKKFFASNPGLKSRFNTFIEFDDYNSKELKDILVRMSKSNDYILDSTLIDLVEQYFDGALSHKGDNFANGRLVRNVFDDMVMNHAKRVVSIQNPSREQLSLLILEDFCSIGIDFAGNEVDN